MELPRVKIKFVNGAMGKVAQSPDGVFLFVCSGTAVTDKFELAKAYVLYGSTWLAEHGITAANNPCIFKAITDFYTEAGEGAETWLIAFPDTVKVSDMVDKAQAYATIGLSAAQGRINGIFPKRIPAVGYTPTITNGMDADVALAMTNAEALIAQYTDVEATPLFVVLEGYAYGGDPVVLTDLHTLTNSSTSVMIGDTVSGSKNAATGILAGRLSASPVQRKVSRVKSGKLKNTTAFIKDKAVEVADIRTIHTKGFITFRTVTRKTGYYFNGDFTATAADDDYGTLTARRTINKAYRIAFDTLTNELDEEIPLNADGTLQAHMVASWQTTVENAIASQMTAYGELNAILTDPNDKGCKCFIDYNQKPLTDNRIAVSIKVKPFGYSSYFDVLLGFLEVEA